MQHKLCAFHAKRSLRLSAPFVLYAVCHKIARYQKKEFHRDIAAEEERPLGAGSVRKVIGMQQQNQYAKNKAPELNAAIAPKFFCLRRYSWETTVLRQVFQLFSFLCLDQLHYAESPACKKHRAPAALRRRGFRLAGHHKFILFQQLDLRVKI